MLIITGKIDASTLTREQIAAVTTPMAVATRQEEGCIEYAFYEDLEQPGHYRIYEEWESEAALAAHFKAPHMATFRAALDALGGVKVDVGRHDSDGRKALF